MQLFRLIFFTIVFCICTPSRAQVIRSNFCETAPPLRTQHGVITKTDCGTAAKGYKQTFSVDGTAVLTDTQLFNEARDDSRTKWVFSSGKTHPETGCPDRIYLIDLSIKPAKVIAFGVNKACNEFHWASWGEKKSVIALKNNVKFTYENGKMTLPPAGEKLWHAIEPPHAGAGLAEEDALPFAEDVPPPK
ncbi:MAG: hypothetical protein V4578_16730 [Pseudomonadota bacterium]